jgi:hypothetical protein
VSRTQNSEFGLYGSNGELSFLVWLGSKYVTAKSDGAVLVPGTWHHVAGVFDGEEVRCYVDGRRVGATKGSGARKPNPLPLLLGADPDANGRGTSLFAGRLDDVRISTTARYAGESFTPAPRTARDDHTFWLLPCDADFGPWTIDRSGQRAHGVRHGSAHCTAEPRQPK